MNVGRVSVEELLAHAAGLRRLAVRLVEDTASADDLVQETLVAGLQFPATGTKPLGPWLARVLRHLASRRWRTERRRAEHERLAARAATSPSTAELVERMELQRVVADEVLKLPEPSRAAILAFYFDDIRAKEHARARGIPAATVRSQVKRGIELLRQRLDERSRRDGTDWTASLIALGRLTAKSDALKRVPLVGRHTLFIAKSALIIAAVGVGAVLIVRMNGSAPAPSQSAAPDPATPKESSVSASPIQSGAREDHAPTTTLLQGDVAGQSASQQTSDSHSAVDLAKVRDDLRAAVEETLVAQINPGRFLDAALVLIELDIDQHAAVKPGFSGTLKIPLLNPPDGMTVELWLSASKSTQYESRVPSLRVTLAPPNDHYSVAGIHRGKADIQISLWTDRSGAVHDFTVVTECQPAPDNWVSMPVAQSGRIVTGAIYHFDVEHPVDAGADEAGIEAGLPYDSEGSVSVHGVLIGERVLDLERLNAGIKLLRSKIH
jgi:RNA polymerase sigma-70 factor (ECF subfamily)